MPILIHGSGEAPPTAESIGALPLSGGTMTGPIAMGGQKITGLGAPAASGDAVPMSYVNARTGYHGEYSIQEAGKSSYRGFSIYDANTAWYSFTLSATTTVTIKKFSSAPDFFAVVFKNDALFKTYKGGSLSMSLSAGTYTVLMFIVNEGRSYQV